MPKDISYYNTAATGQIDPIYNEQVTGVNQQIANAQSDPYYSSLLAGLDATKNREFSGIESRALQRGVGYGNIPTQQQGVYLGERYLPAVAEVKKAQSDRINALQQTLADLRAKRAEMIANRAFDLQKTDISVEEAAKDRAAQAAMYSQQSKAAETPKDPSLAAADQLWAEAEAYGKSLKHSMSPNDTEKRFIPLMVAKYRKLGLEPDVINEIVYTARKPYEGQFPTWWNNYQAPSRFRASTMAENSPTGSQGRLADLQQVLYGRF